MKPNRLLLLLGLGLAACSPARPATTAPTPAAPAPDVEATAPAVDAAPPAAPAPDATAAPATAPPRWWLGDAGGPSVGAGVDRAYRELLAGRAPKRTVVVGVIDSGVDIAHEDLDDNLWANEDEVPGNGVDDDGNGYADDVHGWNFIGGPDGRHVDQDTYEVTRLYAACQEGGASGPAPDVDPSVCGEVATLFERRIQETELLLRQVSAMGEAVDGAVTTLREELGTDSLTEEDVRSVVPMRADVRQAQQIYLQLGSLGITPRMVEEEEERLERLLEQGLNPAFDPRGIVGDDYEDPADRAYGNPDVTGPRASHGTGVAGIIAAERENGIGEDGIAPSVKIMVLRAVPNGDERDKDVANAIRYAVDNGAHVVNMSFGKGFSPWKSAVDDAVRYAESKGVLLVHAAGNEAADVDQEDNFPNRVYRSGGEAGNWIEVGASGWEGQERLAAPFSNYGRSAVDVFAPGVDIRTTDVDNGFQTNSGTSFAAPVVSGLAALIMAYYPELDATDVRRAILESATPYPSTVVVRPGESGETVAFGELSATGGVVDAYAALERAAELARTKEGS